MYPNQPQPPQQPGNQSPYGPAPQPPAQPQPLPGYGQQPQQTYAVDYLDQIAPPPARANFLSGSFGKIIVALAVVFFFTVGIIVALGNQKVTGPTEKIYVKVDNLERVAKQTHVNLQTSSLRNNNAVFQSWLSSAQRDSFDLLTKAGVKKSTMDKPMISAGKKAGDDLLTEFNNAKLEAKLDRIYAKEMAYQTQLLQNELNTMAKNGPAKAFRDFAKNASANLTPIQKGFAEFKENE